MNQWWRLDLWARFEKDAKLERRNLRFADFHEVTNEIQRLSESGYSQAGNWDLGQICKHLALGVSGSVMGRSASSTSWIVQAIVGPFWRRRVLRSGRLPANVPALAAMVPKPGVDPARAAKQLGNAFARFDDHDGPLSPHPFLGKLTKQQWRDFHLIHCAHHLGMLIPRNGENDAADF